MTSVPPPGYETRGAWGFEDPDPPLDPLSRRLLRLAAGLSVLLIALVAFAYLHGSSQTSLNPIAEAAERTAEMPGTRMTFSATYTSPESSLGFVARGEGVVNGRTDRSRAEMHTTVGGREFEIEVVADPHSMYMRSPSFDSELPPGKEWVGVEPFLGHDPQTAFAGGGDVKQQLQMLKGTGGEVDEVGEELVNGVPTTQYRGTIDLDHVVSTLRKEGRAEFAQVVDRLVDAEPTRTIPVEVWVDDNGLVRRMREIQTLPSEPGKPTIRMDMQITFHDFGIEPDIRIPAPSEVFDATPLVQTELGLIGKRANEPVAPKGGSTLSTSAFHARVGDVCGDMKRRLAPLEGRAEALGRRAGQVVQQHGLQSSQAKQAFREMAPFFERLLGGAEVALDRLHRIAPPERVAGAYRRYLNLGERQLDVVRAMTRSLELGSFELTDRLNTRLEQLEKPTKRLAKMLGTSACEDDN